MNFAREAWPLVVPPFVFGVACLVFGMRLSLGWLSFGGVFLVLLALAILLFFRDPNRVPPTDNRLIVSPADGVIVEATTRDNGDRFVAVFLSVLDVHVNRSPFSGTVMKVVDKPGSYLHANSAEGAAGNARIDIELETEFGMITFSQLSGLVARKLSCKVKPGDRLDTGERFGLIYFGSRMEIVMPKTAQIKVKPGVRAVGGETVIAAFGEEQQ